MKIWPTQRVRTVSAFSALTVALATLAVLHDGTETADLTLNDGGVWVTNLNLGDGRSVAAHLNYPSRTLDSFSEVVVPEFDISQEANAIVLHATSTNSITPIDTTTWEQGSLSTLPKDAEAVQGDDVVAVADPNQGKVWVFEASGADSFSPKDAPIVDDVAGVRITVGRDGTAFAVTPDGVVRTISRSGETFVAVESSTVPAFDTADRLSLAAVGSIPVVLDHSAAWLAWPEHDVQLDDALDAVLQTSGDGAGVAALAGPSALVEVPLDGSALVTTEVAANGRAVAPVTVAGCVYAAWAGTGQYVRDCADGTADDEAKIYPELVRDPDSQLSFRVNRDVVVLNDASNGDIFLVNEDMFLIDDWQLILSQIEDDEKQQKKDDVELRTFRRTKENRPPKPEDDRFGVRAGTSVTLPVLANDTDPDGDVLLASVEDPATRMGDLELVRSGRAIRIDVPDDATGGDSFTYLASDGRSKGDQPASVQVAVHPAGQNAGPKQIPGRTSETTMVQRGDGEHRILPEWIDPDGDPFWVDHVVFPKGMDGTFRADGLIQLSDDGTQPPGRHEVEVYLTDGRSDPTLATLVVRVKPRVPLPPTANADFVTATVGDTAEVRPLVNDTDPNGDPLFITNVKSVPGLQVSGDYSNGTISISGDREATTYLEYTISDGQNAAPGVIRVDVTADQPSAAKPVPDDDLAVLPRDGEVLVDVLSNDTDPLGGVLVLQSVTTDDAQRGLTAEILDHEVIRIRNNGLGPAPTTLYYQVGNANGSATGRVTVVEDQTRKTGTPVASDDTGIVRSGDIVTVDVLDNDVSPSGSPLTVQPDLDVIEGADLGTAFVSNNEVRFKADADAGAVRIKYTVTDDDLNPSTGTLDVSIVPVSGSNSAPAPELVTARLVQGGSTDVLVPLDDIDPDGDSVTLLGLDNGVGSVPTKGVAQVEGGVITYTASSAPGNTGTDEFTYLVEDRFGAQATGRVRVGIAPLPTANADPITAPDTLRARPGRLLSIPVTLNDIDPEGEPVRLVVGSVDPADATTGTVEATVEDGRVSLTTPAAAAVLRYTYVVRDPAGGKATGSLVVQVQDEAPLQAPVARDDIVRLSDIVGKNEVTVDVLKNDEDPDGAASVLTPTSETSGVAPTTDGRLVVPLLPERQVIVYTVTDEDDQVGKAVVVVPGLGSLAAQRPVVRSDAPLPLKVKAGELLSIDISDLVAVRPGRSPSVSFTEGIRPGPGWAGNDREKLRNPTTLLFRSDPDFYGPTAVTFEVTDARNRDDDTALTAVLTLPIEVEANGRTQPTLRAPTVTVTPGEEPWRGNLLELATDRDPGDQDRLDFSTSGVPDDLTVVIENDSELVVSARDGVTEGVSREFTLTVTDTTTDAVSVTVRAEVVATTRAPMTVRPAVVTGAKAGDPVKIDVSDYVTNPYADTGGALTLVGQPRLDGPGTASTSGTTITVVPDADSSGALNVTYLVADASGDAGRNVQGQIRIQVLGRPDAPTAVVAEATKSHTVEVSWRAGANNGSPISKFTVSWTGGTRGSKTVGARTSTVIGDLPNDKDYVFTVVATNAVDDSDPSLKSRPARPDEIPAAPTTPRLSFGDTSIDVTWTQPRYEGSPVRKYQVFYNGSLVTTDGPATKITLSRLTNGMPYKIKVRGINDAEAERDGIAGAGLWSDQSIEHPNAVPATPTAPTATGTAPDADPSANVDWYAPDDGGHDIARYEVRRTGSTALVCHTPGGSTACDVDLAEGQDYTFEVRAFNRANGKNIDGWSDWSRASASVRGAGAPGPVTDLKAVPTGTSGQAKITFGDANDHGAESIEYYYRLQGGGSGQITSGNVLGGFADGEPRDVTVWAVSTANGKTSSPGPEETDGASSFAPCTVSVNYVRSNYDTVTFHWDIASHGRECDASGDVSGRSGNRNGDSDKSAGANGGGTTFRVTVSTVQTGDDANVANNSDEASGSTWQHNYTVRHNGVCSGAGTPSPAPAGCTKVQLRLDDWRPNSNVTCQAAGAGGYADWHHVYTTNSSGDADYSGQHDPGGYLFDSNGSKFRDGTNTGEFTCSQN